MRHALIALAAASLMAAPAIAQTPSPSAPAPAGAYAADKTHTSIMWKGLHNGLSYYVARFTTFDIQLTFDQADVSKSKVTATIDPKSIETDYTKTRPAGNTTDFNNELATGERFLNGVKFPSITFTSTAITKTGENTGKMTGNLTFLGVTKPVTLDVTFNGHRNDPRLQKHKVGFLVTGKFKRSDFGMSAGGALADEISVEINSELIQK
jgi:polyisoprenoid-binding protein YceI